MCQGDGWQGELSATLKVLRHSRSLTFPLTDSWSNELEPPLGITAHPERHTEAGGEQSIADAAA